MRNDRPSKPNSITSFMMRCARCKGEYAYDKDTAPNAGAEHAPCPKRGGKLPCTSLSTFGEYVGGSRIQVVENTFTREPNEWLYDVEFWKDGTLLMTVYYGVEVQEQTRPRSFIPIPYGKRSAHRAVGREPPACGRTAIGERADVVIDAEGTAHARRHPAAAEASA